MISIARYFFFISMSYLFHHDFLFFQIIIQIVNLLRWKSQQIAMSNYFCYAINEFHDLRFKYGMFIKQSASWEWLCCIASYYTVNNFISEYKKWLQNSYLTTGFTRYEEFKNFDKKNSIKNFDRKTQNIFHFTNSNYIKGCLIFIFILPYNTKSNIQG